MSWRKAWNCGACGEWNSRQDTQCRRCEADVNEPLCARVMKCLCWGHANGAAADEPCNPCEPRQTTCDACGEYWPCTVATNRGAYRADVAALHGPKGEWTPGSDYADELREQDAANERVQEALKDPREGEE